MNYLSSEIFMGFFLRSLPQLAIFIACVVFLVKKKRVDAILLTIGSSIGLVSNIFQSIGLSILSDSSSMTKMLNTIGVISFFGSLIFVAGFIILIIKSINTFE